MATPTDAYAALFAHLWPYHPPPALEPGHVRIWRHALAVERQTGHGPTEQAIREAVFERGLHPQTFAEFMATGLSTDWLERYTDDAGAVRYRAIPQPEPEPEPEEPEGEGDPTPEEETDDEQDEAD